MGRRIEWCNCLSDCLGLCVLKFASTNRVRESCACVYES